MHPANICREPQDTVSFLQEKDHLLGNKEKYILPITNTVPSTNPEKVLQDPGGATGFSQQDSRQKLKEGGVTLAENESMQRKLFLILDKPSLLLFINHPRPEGCY